jgi:hypothetical protein
VGGSSYKEGNSDNLRKKRCESHSVSQYKEHYIANNVLLKNCIQSIFALTFLLTTIRDMKNIIRDRECGGPSQARLSRTVHVQVVEYQLRGHK